MGLRPPSGITARGWARKRPVHAKRDHSETDEVPKVAPNAKWDNLILPIKGTIREPSEPTRHGDLTQMGLRPPRGIIPCGWARQRHRSRNTGHSEADEVPKVAPNGIT